MTAPENIALPEPRAGRYAWYVLALLFVVYVLNFVDRQIITILAQDIKRDLGLRDEDIGFLYGTAFGVFYSLFGIPLGRLADSWHRGRLITLGLAGWQAAFLSVGIPGILLALWIATLKEPIRGRMDGIDTPSHPAPFRAFGEELLAIIPPFTLLGAARQGARALSINLIGAAVIALVAYAIISVDGAHSIAQWSAVAIGSYAVFSWATTLKRRDPATFRLIVATPAVIATIIAYGLNAFVAYGVALWAPSYAVTVLGQTKASSGAILGSNAAIAGFAGITLGGVVADRLRRRYANGRLIVVFIGNLLPLPFVIGAFTATQPAMFYTFLFVASVVGPFALGSSAATVQDLVLPRMRGTATAAYFIGTTLLGLAIGPYLAGRISTATGSLATGVLSLLAVVPIGLIATLIAWRTVPAAEASREARAREVGEPI